MPFEPERLIRISGGETDHTFPGAINFAYESAIDSVANMLVPGYFNKAEHLLRIGSILQVTFWYQTLPAADVGYDLLRVVEPYPDQYGLGFDVVLAKVIIPPPLVQYQIMAERSLTFVTSGGPVDTVAYPESEVGMFVSYSLNSQVNDVAPPGAHQGIEYIEAQAAQIEINWGRPVAPGQTIRVWTQLRADTPLP